MFKQSGAGRGWVTRGFTLSELLAVVAMITVAIALLLPSLRTTRGQGSRRTVCAANLGSIGRAALTYAEINKGVLPSSLHDPSLTGTDNLTATRVGYNRYLPDGSIPGVNDGSSTRSWFKLLAGGKAALLDGKRLVCHAAKPLHHVPTGARATVLSVDGVGEAPVYDFNGGLGEDGLEAAPTSATEMTEFSYSFAVTLRYKSDGIMWGSLLLNTQDPGKAIAADRNPYSNEVIMRRANSPGSFIRRVGDSTRAFSTGFFGTYTYAKHKPPSKTQGFTAPPADLTGADYVTALLKQKSANSRNHNQEGQNVAYLDGHAKWANNPKVGVDDDSIWSNWQHDKGVPVLDPKTRLPYDAEPPTRNEYGLMRARSDWATDSVLMP